MRGIVLSILLLAASSYAWPSLYKRSSGEASFLIVTLIGLVAVILLGWLSPRIESSGRLRLEVRRIVFLILCSLPVAALEVAFGAAYWLQIGGGQLHIGALSALPVALVALWAIADAGIHGICEEAVFRGLLQPAMMKKYHQYAGGVLVAILITTFWFLVVHLYGITDFRLLPYLAFLSILYGYLVVQTQYFMSSAILHVLHNAIALLVAHVGLPKTIFGYSEPGFFWLGVLAIVNFFALNRLAKEWIKAGTGSKEEKETRAHSPLADDFRNAP